MDESVVEGCVDASNTEDKLALSDLGAEGDSFGLSGSGLLGRLHHPFVSNAIHPNSGLYEILRAVRRIQTALAAYSPCRMA